MNKKGLHKEASELIRADNLKKGISQYIDLFYYLSLNPYNKPSVYDLDEISENNRYQDYFHEKEDTEEYTLRPSILSQIGTLDLDDLIERTPELSEREIVCLKAIYQEGLTFRQAALNLQIKVGNLHRTTKRALSKIKKNLFPKTEKGE